MHLANSNSKNPKILALNLGERLKQARLNQNITQEQIAEAIGVNRRTIINAEKGQVTLINLIAILQKLDLASQLDLLLPEQPISPIQLAKLQGSKRQRASKQAINNPEIESEW